MAKDTDDNQPVSIEDEIESIIASGEEEAKDDESKEEEEQSADGESESEEDSSEETKEDSDNVEGDTDTDESALEENGEDDAEPVSDDSPDDQGSERSGKLEAPEHWAAADRETFNEQTPESQEWLLKRHKEMEGAMTRKSQEFASDKRQYDAISDALSPYKAEFAAAGLDQAGAVRQLAGWHESLKTGGKETILRLAQMYNIDLDGEDHDEFDDPALSGIKKELSALKQQTAQQQALAQQEQQNQLQRQIDDFVAETDEAGTLKHPHFNTLYEDMTKLFSSGMANDLSDAYNKALALRPELNVQKTVSKPVIKQDQALKVKKAKKAATGIKSSGATKRKRAELSLEEEIAAQM